MKRIFCLLLGGVGVVGVSLAANAAASVNTTNVVPNLRVLTNATTPSLTVTQINGLPGTDGVVVNYESGTSTNGLKVFDGASPSSHLIHWLTSSGYLFTPVDFGTLLKWDSTPAITLIGTAVNSFESGRLRFTEDASTFLGAYVHYDGFNNLLKIGVHSATDSSTNSDTTVLAIHRDTAKVGIGTTAPSAKLTIYGNVSFLADTVRTTYIDLNSAYTEESVSGAVVLAHATNGAANTKHESIKVFYNSSGSDQPLTIPALWRTNTFSAVPTALTNGWITQMLVRALGSTATAAAQTNCYVRFEFYK